MKYATVLLQGIFTQVFLDQIIDKMKENDIITVFKHFDNAQKEENYFLEKENIG